jgi:hypothetical protein
MRCWPCRHFDAVKAITEAGTDRAQGWRLAAREIEEAAALRGVHGCKTLGRLALGWFDGMPRMPSAQPPVATNTIDSAGRR